MHLFNPWHDLALSNFTPNYTPPASAIQMTEELAVLPVWYGEGDAVIAEGKANQAFVDAIREVLPVPSDLILPSEIALRPREKIIPWGWSPALCKRLQALGATERQIPSIEELQRLRKYADRQNAVQLLRELKDEGAGFCGESHYFTRLEELLTFLQSIPGNKVLKMPVSGSGKGLIWVLGDITDKQTDWCRRVIREQGGVVAEPALHKVQDFAMEFYLDQGVPRFAGYSLFRSALSGAYTGNELLSDQRIMEKLSLYFPTDLLQRLRDSLIQKLVRMFPLYSGYVGVDMMICKTDEGYSVQPCVEINMRMNMGMVARIFQERYVHPGREGRFVVDYLKKPGGTRSFHEKMQREFPLTIENGKILSGYLSLTPVSSDTHYIAYVVV